MLSLKEQVIRIFLGLIVGAIIGLERKYRGKPAGVRTHAIICVICTMLTIVSAYGFKEFGGTGDPSRLISNILTGVGFLAGGVIYSVNRGDKKTVHGLTTAAGVWGAACLGIPIGLGLYAITLITLSAIQLILFVEGVLIRNKSDLSEDDFD
ncbi:MAG: MgtC/SapB family protein [Cellulosilyticaceae bacterium]